MNKKMKNKITNSSFWMCIWLLFGITVVQAQSGSRGNTYIFGGGHATVHGGNHNFVNGGSGTQPGIVGTARTTPAGNLAFMPGTTWSGAANDAHVDGYVRSYQTGAFTFPIGDNGSYRPAAVSAASASNPADAAYYGVNPNTAVTSSLAGGNEPALPTGAPFALTAVAAGVGPVQNKEYWDVNGAEAAKITLTWDAASDIATLTNSTLASLLIVGWDGTQWVSIPATVDTTSLLGGISDLTAGSITTNAAIVPNTYTVYTFAAIGDSDGDGDPDITDPTPNDPCVWSGGQILANVTPTWQALDCDGDGVINGTEVTDGTNPLDQCSLTASNITVATSSTWNSADCDGDGVINSTELIDSTNPTDGCSYLATSVLVATSATWQAADCDVDGNPNCTDPNVLTPTAVNDAITATFDPAMPTVPTTINILTNDDFLANDGNIITQTGGNAAGTVTFDPVTGIMSYTPVASEIGNTVTVQYLVCQGAVCSTATVNITVETIPDLTPTIDIDGLEFPTAGNSRDFVVNLYEINNKVTYGTAPRFRISKLSAFTITYATQSGTANVLGSTPIQNGNWTFTENANFITVTANAGTVIPANGSATIGFTATRKPSIPGNTSQSITATILNGSGSENNTVNNTVDTKVSAN